MRNLGLLILSAAIWTGCAGDDAALEKARYLLGQGGTANAQEALTLVTPVLTSGSLTQKFDAYQTYAGAQTVLAGFNATRVIGVLKYPGAETSATTQTVKLINAVYTSNSSSSETLATTITALQTFVDSSDFTTSTDTAGKNAVTFQLGLVQFFKSLQTLIDDSGFASSTFSLATCTSSNLTASRATIDTNLGSSETNLTNAGLASGNKLVDMISDLRDKTDDIDELCEQLDIEND